MSRDAATVERFPGEARQPAEGVAEPTGGAGAARGQAPGVHLLVLSSLFPHAGRPVAGVFIQERMFRVARRIPAVFVVPVPWFPGQSLIRRFRPGFRPPAPRSETRDGHCIHYPRFFSVPGVLKSLDGLFMALAVILWLRRHPQARRPGTVLDAHFGYPDGVAAMWVARWFRLPFSVTFRGNEQWYCTLRPIRRQLRRLMRRASRVFAVSSALGALAARLGAPTERIEVVPNGVNTEIFRPLDKGEMRERLDIAEDAKVLITVGSLLELKGQHRVIEVLPELAQRHPEVLYLLVGGEDYEPGWRSHLEELARKHGVAERVRFLGRLPPNRLAEPLSAADAFVLPSSREGWPNVILEAAACGLVLVGTDIPGIREASVAAGGGLLFKAGDQEAMTSALDRALAETQDRELRVAAASRNGWDERVEALVRAFRGLSRESLENTDG